MVQVGIAMIFQVHFLAKVHHTSRMKLIGIRAILILTKRIQNPDPSHFQKFRLSSSGSAYPLVAQALNLTIQCISLNGRLFMCLHSPTIYCLSYASLPSYGYKRMQDLTIYRHYNTDHLKKSLFIICINNR